MILLSQTFPASVAALLPDAVLEPTLAPHTALIVDDATGDLDAILLASAVDVLEAALGKIGAFVTPLAAFEEARRTLLIAGHLAPARDGATEVEDRARRETRRVRWSAVASALLTVQELGVGVAYCCDDERAVVDMMMMLARRDRRPVVARRFIDPRSAAISWLAALPGVGEETARALLDYAQSPAHALCALTGGDAPPRVARNGAWTRAVREAKAWLGLANGVRLFVTCEDGHEPDHHRS